MKKTYLYSKKRGFTLAEAFTTLLVIGIIATLTITVWNDNTTDKILEAQKKTFTIKLNSVLKILQARGRFATGINSTDEFISAMEKEANIVKKCSANNLTGCFAKQIKYNKTDVKYETKDLTDSESIESNNVTDSALGGVVFTDGTTAIITYQPGCASSNQFDITSDVTSCLSIIYDVNGINGPNIIGSDIATINLPWGNPQVDYNEIISKVYKPTGYTKEQCEKAQNDGASIINCATDGDYWAMAVDTCFKQGKELPTPAELLDMASQLYGTKISDSTSVKKIVDKKLYNKLGGKTSLFYSNHEYSWSPDYRVWTLGISKTSVNIYNTSDNYVSKSNASSKVFFCVDRH